MERLSASDPSHLDEYRLLGRLGAGGMGVVYLARAASGDLAAVKVIQPEYAEEHDFRARFRREAASARQVDSPWVVPVLGADVEAEAPWLATAFVPGPSLAEAVAHCGPLPVRATRVLGKVLARALGAVHRAGLVHRDVKPGNILLAPDGPRLIDFGIARPTAADATELTSELMVVGTPGFLSPEQARAQPVTPASDVFALGCVLAYATTGQLPFGGGAVDAVLYRTVHDRPALDGIEDTALRDLLERCLAKDPATRPSADEVDTLLLEDAPPGSVDWLPDPVVRMVADRSAEMLALPGIEPTEVPASTAEARPAPARRRILLAGGAALLAAGGGTAAWVALREDGGGAASGGGGRPWVLGLHADLSGPRGTAGRAQERGVRLAVEEYRARRRRPFPLELEVVDDRGRSANALRGAQRLTGDRDVLAVVGPTGAESVTAALEVYEGAGLPLLSVSELSFSAAQDVLLAPARCYFRTVPLAAYTALATIARLRAQGVRRPGLLADRAGRIAGWELVTSAQSAAESLRSELYIRAVPAAAADPAVVVDDMLDHEVDGLFYTGTAERAGSVARALARRGFPGPRFLDPSSATTVFTAAAGQQADGWQVLAPYISPKAAPVRDFAAAHRRRYGTAPDVWAAEAYDTARLVVDRLTALAAKGSRPSRAQLTEALTRARFKGMLTTYSFDKELQVQANSVHRYRADGGRFVYAGAAGLSG
ncbi:bifunctional serine/threonine-protein kinase/ABC transporter substrate-binding protein [Streptomyces sp. LRE541]|uniref:bifunctional serine/threonine-protein kinase/ABC transporter substrate-binding protein n=1 Tax=Streptomyces sp. LRE541 TaxID=2931983 RepID=UPI00200BE8BF|nr:bifunctional serine/threonine-protein kinase/ABC transporter substrate-binding protein [Streptomyces sp. LRE541]UPZ27567.1 bifunctional serine/threonine-protein kinase/ABC transporter substrate-binding protein [Streptomyces sp. LRE541]